MKNGLYTRIYKKALIFIVSFVGIGIAFGLASSNFQKINADTNYYYDISPYVINDWQNYEDITHGSMTMTNNGDGTFTVNGSTTAITDFVIPTTLNSIERLQSFSIYLALLKDNALVADSNVTMYLAYNNGANITNYYCNLGSQGTTTQAMQGALRENVCLVIRFKANVSYTSTVFTPFCLFQYEPTTFDFAYNTAPSVYAINKLLGPTSSAPTPPADLTKVNYISSAATTSLVISTQVNMTFGNQLQNLIQYSFEEGDTITVDNTGETALYIDLLTMTAGNDSYIMRFNNDAQSNDYLSVYLYKNNDYVYLYNDNTGEITAGNITAFRTWGVDAINNGATITSGSQYNNNIINKIYVYSTGTNYETGYTNGYRDGYDAGEADGYEDGTANGYGLGYQDGYDQGAIDGLDTSWLVNLFEAVNTFFDITILPGIKIGTIFAIPFVLSIAWVIIRILRGGGYGD